MLTIVVLLSAALLTFVNTLTEPKINEQEAAQTKSMLLAMFPDMTTYELKSNGIYVIDSGSNLIGYAFLATGKGYGGDISILVGLEDATTVKAISIVSQSETPGLGSRITLSSFLDRFIGKKITDVKLTKDGGEIDAITGSTISSRAVVDAVRETALEKVKELPAS